MTKFSGPGRDWRLDGLDETNGSTSGADAPASQSGRDNVTIGGIKNSGGEFGIYGGDIGEVLYYDSALSAGDIALVEAYLLAKWGVSTASTLRDFTSFYKLGEVSGTRDDESQRELDLNLVTTATQAVGVSASTGNAAQFTGGTYLSRGDTGPGNPHRLADPGGTASFSISAWVYLDSKPADLMGIVSKFEIGAGRALEYTLYWNHTSDRFVFDVTELNTTGFLATADAFGAPSTGTWYHIVARRDDAAGLVKIKINDSFENTTAMTTGKVVTSGSQPLYIGKRSTAAGNTWLGRIDAVGLWPRAIIDAEITELYNAGLGKQPIF